MNNRLFKVGDKVKIVITNAFHRIPHIHLNKTGTVKDGYENGVHCTVSDLSKFTHWRVVTDDGYFDDIINSNQIELISPKPTIIIKRK